MSSISVEEAASHFGDVVNRVVSTGERAVLLEGNRPVAEISAVVRPPTLRELAAVLASLPRLSREEADAFSLDVRDAQTLAASTAPRSPWD